MSQNFSSLKKFTSRAFSYLLETPQQHASILSYTKYNLPVKYKYKRPEHLELDAEATVASADHEIRPVMRPKRPLIMNAGYAEVINAGKTLQINEDQSCCSSFVITVPINQRDENWTTEMCQIPCVYYAVFDGHAGTGAALCAYNRLHLHIMEKLTEISHMIILSSDDISQRYLSSGLITSISKDELIIGALEQAFQIMDEEIKQQRYSYRLDGGCTAIVALFIYEKLYVSNAGDCRAVVYKDSAHHQLSFDHTPESERQRLQAIALHKPSLLVNSYTRLQFQHRCRKKDCGTKQMYRDYNMIGWGLKLIDKNDLKPQLVTGEGKRARLLDTIGTSRGFGDHDLEVPYAVGIKIKPFLTAAPEVQVFDLNQPFSDDDVLVMASDGLWEKLSNAMVGDILTDKLSMQKPSEKRRYIVAAQGVVAEAKGVLGERGWRTLNNEIGSYDDISVFVVPLACWKSTLSSVLQSHRLKITNEVVSAEYLNIPDPIVEEKNNETKRERKEKAMATDM